MTQTLPDAAKAWIDAHEFATLATIEPDGRPHLSVVWIAYHGDDLLISTVEGRRKHQNLVRDPRASVLIHPREQPYSYLEVRGTTSMTREGGRELIDALAQGYTGAQRYTMDDGTDNVRVVVRLTPEKVLLR
jgi:PPOX class probable F420-dependent enzyme